MHRRASAICLQYKDGLKATILQTERDFNRWNVAVRLKGEEKPRSFMHFSGPWGNRCLFRALAHAMQRLVVEQREPYPIERTVLTTGALDAAMRSYAKREAVTTMHLELPYQATDWRRFREDGTSWRVITADSEENTQFEPGDEKRVASK